MRFGWRIFLLMFVFIGSVVSTRAQDQPRADVPWDSLVASIKTIDSSLKPDSLKGALLRQVFDSYHITLEDYRHFYRKMMSDSPKEQTRFLTRVKEILESRVKEVYQPRKKPKGKPVPGGKPNR